MTMPLQPKAIHDEMNSTTFDEFGRMQANLGVEAQPPTPGAAERHPVPVREPGDGAHRRHQPAEGPIVDHGRPPDRPIRRDDGTQIWQITHNGVDTHPIHFHLYDVQVLNRVTWDNIIIPPDATELGWKDTVRVSPLEDTIVALRPIIPQLPFELPEQRSAPLNPMMPTGSTAMFNNIDPQGNPTATDRQPARQLRLGVRLPLPHPEPRRDGHDAAGVAGAAADQAGRRSTLSITGTGNNRRIVVTWNDNSITETVVRRPADAPTARPGPMSGPVTSPLDQPNTHGVRTRRPTPTSNASTAYLYRVVAQNTVGYGGEFPSMTVQSVSADCSASTRRAAPDQPDRDAAGRASGQPDLAGQRHQRDRLRHRAVDQTAAPSPRSRPRRPATAPATSTFVDTTTLAGNTYTYRVAAVNVAGTSAFSTTALVTFPAAPAAPTSLTAANDRGPVTAA